MSLAQSPDNPTPPPAKGWRLLLIRLLRGMINFLNLVIISLEQPGTEADSLGKTYSQTLGKVRSFLPIAVRDKLPDWGLSGAIAFLTVLVFWTTGSLLFPNPKPVNIPRPVAVMPSPEPLVAPDVPPVASPSPSPVAIPEVSPALPETPVATTPVIPEPTSGEVPEVVPEPTPAPSPALTPEQVLIASIQEQVTEILPQDAELITAIKPNFSGSLLKITVSQDWYDLSAEKQDQLAAKVEERSQDLDFRQLLITDSTGHLVARKAVVGKGMIILRRLLA